MTLKSSRLFLACMVLMLGASQAANSGEVLVLTTEKDAMRLRGQEPGQELKEAFHAVRIHVHFLNDDKEEFDRQILDYVHSNKRSSVLHQGEDQ